MRQLTALDAQFLNVESATTTAHVAGLAILDPADGAVTRDALARLLLDRMHLSPALSLRLVPVPFGLDHPYWAADPGFDIANHLFETVLPEPGDQRRLAEEVARIHARRLDRAHPLWEMHLIRGLAGGLVAVYTKVHHAAIDGVTGAETLAALLDLAPGDRRASASRAGATVVPLRAPAGTRGRSDQGSGRGADQGSGRSAGQGSDEGPGLARMLAGAAVRNATQPVRALRSAVRAAADLDAIPLVSTLPGAGLISRTARFVSGDRHERPEVPRLAAPRTPFNGPVSAERRVAFGSVPLKDVKSVAKANGISVNDVVMTLCASALRAWLVERAALPEEPLVAAVPVAVRGGGGRDGVGNHISAIVAPLPTNVAGVRERLRETGAAMRAAKRRFAQAPASWLEDLCSVLPAPVTALATPALFRLASVAFPPVNIIVSNVPGPQFPLYLCGGRVLSYYPLSVVSDVGGGLNITCFSYDGMLDFGVVACPERVDDVWELLGHLRAALDELLDLDRA
ncbi:WS/DGAT/MGAT family O-acyltransferase [Nonomuraea rhodomycinica]|uniref:Diacylglycerol O-acyltransferase n=1 Tax=Nonomuraea rhodomycinica TaxID=1712872 RepID=A0A7Y6MH32_9ACTN|nr:wax ester/triacylglycerol synthase family O-acyltransferase [Nonomuraea rhodomycinica]NUW46549.1 wax ester/triacylglycerol synthase family O-acyltransferase [Nonomuraea rhodomycinica]